MDGNRLNGMMERLACVTLTFALGFVLACADLSEDLDPYRKGETTISSRVPRAYDAQGQVLGDVLSDHRFLTLRSPGGYYYSIYPNGVPLEVQSAYFAESGCSGELRVNDNTSDFGRPPPAEYLFFVIDNFYLGSDAVDGYLNTTTDFDYESTYTFATGCADTPSTIIGSAIYRVDEQPVDAAESGIPSAITGPLTVDYPPFAEESP